jgi:hypothetical protein
MAESYRAQFLKVLRENEAAMTGLFRGLADRVTALIVRSAGGDGNIQPGREKSLREAIGGEVTSLFLTPSGTGLAAFEVSFAGKVTPRSRYMRTLWAGIEAATFVGVDRHAAMMRRALRDEPELLRRLQRARQNPFQAGRRTQEMALFRANPLASYEAAHTWVDPRGYRLSDRLWQISGDTRRRIDLLLAEGIAEGRSAINLAKDLEDLLIPGRELLRTNRPYGRDASFDALRLARTEITRAHSEADLIAANMNPFVEGLVSVLSGSHPKADICDDYAAESEAQPWPKDSPPARIPYHPQCLCYWRWVTAEKPETVRKAMRRQAAENDPFFDLVGPLLIGQLVRMLLGEEGIGLAVVR